MAAKWLGVPVINRAISKNKVAQHKKTMEDGLWNDEVCPPIILGDKNCVLDGRHRLSAVVASGIATSFNELVTILNEVLNTNLKQEYFNNPYDLKTYQSNTQADTTLAEKRLGWKAKYKLKAGIKEYMELLKNEI